MHLHLYTYRKTRMLLKNNRPHKIAIIIHSLSLLLAIVFIVIFTNTEPQHFKTQEGILGIVVMIFGLSWFSLLGLPTAIISLKKNQRDPYRLIGLKNLFTQSFTVPSSLFSILITCFGIFVLYQQGKLGMATVVIIIFSVYNNLLALILFLLSIVGCLLIWHKRQQIAKR